MYSFFTACDFSLIKAYLYFRSVFNGFFEVFQEKTGKNDTPFCLIFEAFAAPCSDTDKGVFMRHKAVRPGFETVICMSPPHIHCYCHLAAKIRSFSKRRQAVIYCREIYYIKPRAE